MSDAAYSENKLTFRQMTQTRVFVGFVSLVAVGGLTVLILSLVGAAKPDKDKSQVSMEVEP